MSGGAAPFGHASHDDARESGVGRRARGAGAEQQLGHRAHGCSAHRFAQSGVKTCPRIPRKVGRRKVAAGGDERRAAASGAKLLSQLVPVDRGHVDVKEGCVERERAPRRPSSRRLSMTSAPVGRLACSAGCGPLPPGRQRRTGCIVRRRRGRPKATKRRVAELPSEGQRGNHLLGVLGGHDVASQTTEEPCRRFEHHLLVVHHQHQSASKRAGGPP